MECIVGCFQQVLEDPPPMGSVITVKHNGAFQNGTLRHPFFWRLKEGVHWHELSKETRVLVLLFNNMTQQFAEANWMHHQNRVKFFQDLYQRKKMKSLDDFYSA